MRKRKEKYIIKSSHDPVSGLNTYSVFKDDTLVFMIDGDRASVFKQDEVESIIFAFDPTVMIYRVSKWLFVGTQVLPPSLLSKLPKSCTIVSSTGKQCVM